MLTFYELDLGLNHVVRKYSEPLEDTANLLIRGNYHDIIISYYDIILFSVPGGSDGPSGTLVCCENYLLYKNFGDQPDLRCPIPRRKVWLSTSLIIHELLCVLQNDLDDAERSMLFVCSATHKTKVKASVHFSCLLL